MGEEQRSRTVVGAILIVLGVGLLAGAFGLISRGNRETTPLSQE